MDRDRKHRPEEHRSEELDELRDEGTEKKIMGTAREMRGRAEQAVGDILDDGSLKRKGSIRKASGRIERRVGDAVEDAVDEVDRRDDVA